MKNLLNIDCIPFRDLLCIYRNIYCLFFQFFLNQKAREKTKTLYKHQTCWLTMVFLHRVGFVVYMLLLYFVAFELLLLLYFTVCCIVQSVKNPFDSLKNISFRLLIFSLHFFLGLSWLVWFVSLAEWLVSWLYGRWWCQIEIVVRRDV